MPCLRFLLCLPLMCSLSVAEDHFSASDIEFFESKIRPLLIEHCYECHSGKGEIEGGLRVDYRDGLLKGGDTGPAIVPKEPDHSRIIEAISYNNVDLEMPPQGKLPRPAIDLLTEWVERGSPWPDEQISLSDNEVDFDLHKRMAEHWCWRPIKDPAIPKLLDDNWSHSDIDRFIYSRLEENGLSPTQDADRITLIRRAYFDLIGLPPTPNQVDRFLNDQDESAFEKVIDELLDSPHFGERWARHWMDLFRYAESHGHEFDYPIHHAYKYRDYLIRAFNADVPYDDFIVEQIAGDLVERPRLRPDTGSNESAIGTAFWWLGEATHAPVTVKEDEAIRIDNQIDVLTKSFLALTVSCARCHDHKFDAISTRDYYAMAGVLQSSRRTETLVDPGGKIAETVAEMRLMSEKGNSMIRDIVADNMPRMDARLTSYLLAAHEVMFGSPASVFEVRKPFVFEDFEKPHYENWTVEGDAFGEGPHTQDTVSSVQGKLKANGKGFVNSYHVRGSNDQNHGDRATGKMTSVPFKIAHRFVQFLIGGGNHAGKTCVNIVVDGQVVGSRTGFNANEMRPVHIDLTKHFGKRATIQIVDEHQGGWGNIGVDHIVFQDQKTLTPRSVEAVAMERRLNSKTLSRFVDLLQSPAIRSAEHPLHLWHRFTETGDFPPESFAALRRSFESANDKRDATESTHPVFADFSDGIPEGWFTTGVAFSNSKDQGIAWRWEEGHLRVTDRSGVSSRAFGQKLSGTLRSPTFELTHNQIHFLARGSDVKARLIIDGYYMFDFNGLLFGGMTTELKSDSDMQWMTLAGDIRRYKGHRAYIELIDDGNAWAEIKEIRFSDQAPSKPFPNPMIAELVEQSVPDSIESLADAYSKALINRAPVLAQVLRLLNGADFLSVVDSKASELLVLQRGMVQKLQAAPEPDRILGLVDGTPENERIFIRGNHKTLGAEVPRQLLEALVGEQQSPGERSGRLRLARQIASADNPLTARVVVNRIWHHLFGRGIVASTDNFGVLGERPTHPQLLDYLARIFIKGEWSVKSMIKEIMLSRTYRMDSTPVIEAAMIDPTNQYLHRQRIRRLQGEAIRDAILAVSGRLDRKLFGPSVPVNLTSFMSGRGRPRSGPVDGNGRRSIYSSVRRNFLSPMMLAFDTPIPFTTIGRRNVSNVPAQALILMNSPFVIEQTKVWANRMLSDGAQQWDQRIRSMYRTAFSRDPTTEQMEAARGFLAKQGTAYGLAKDKLMLDQRVWADFGHVLFNAKTFSFVY